MIAQIRPSQLKDWTKHVGVEPIVLDVREPSELLAASVKADGFELRTIPMATIPVRLNELDPDRPIACLCHHGGRSMQVAAFLGARGFRQVANIAGGIHAWSDEVDNSVPRY